MGKREFRQESNNSRSTRRQITERLATKPNYFCQNGGQVKPFLLFKTHRKHFIPLTVVVSYLL